ncbi:MAG TPA: oxidoreductase [Microvirga sp.]|jgi:NAD(P)-dependent dehydrogenase (short-subunit alcohol dehydrogenase family)|nr:oxidoreductase [Microvirga sp.]
MTTERKSVWLVTGCSSGFGRQIAEHLLGRGERVIVTARKPEQVEDLAEGREALVLPLDVTDPKQAQVAVSKAEERFGGIDVLVNNAGLGYFAAIEESDEDAVRMLFEVNFFGVATMIRAALPGMRRRRSGTIVNITSIGGLEGYPAVGFYCATKYAVEGLSDVLRKEVAPLGIHVMTVEPGAFRTEWAGSARETTRPIADYDATAGAARRAYHASVGRQQGDPAKAAVAIGDAVLGASPPKRLLLGADAYEAATAKLGEMLREFTGWEAMARCTDFDNLARG